MDHAYLHGTQHVAAGYHFLYDTMKRAWQREAENGQKIEAIKVYRLMYNAGLKEAKDAVEHYTATHFEHMCKETILALVPVIAQHVIPAFTGNRAEREVAARELIKRWL